MRRLNPFEEKVIKNIYNHKVTKFKDLVKPYLDNEFYFKIGKLRTEEAFTALITSESQDEHRIYFYVRGYFDANKIKRKELIEQMFYKLNDINNIERLIRLLETNGLINIYEYDKIEDSFFIGKSLKEDENDLFKAGFNSTIPVQRLISINFSTISPTPALEIYIKNGFRTDEQKNNDFLRWVNILAVGAAIIGVVLTGIFSTLSYFKESDTKTEIKK